MDFGWTPQLSHSFLLRANAHCSPELLPSVGCEQPRLSPRKAKDAGCRQEGAAGRRRVPTELSGHAAAARVAALPVRAGRERGLMRFGQKPQDDVSQVAPGSGAKARSLVQSED